MENPAPENEPTLPPEVPSEIPSAVRSTSSWNTLTLAAFAVVGLAVIWIFKGGSRKPTESAVSSANADPSVWVSPASPLAAMKAMVPQASMQVNDGASLLEVRRKSPMVIFNDNAAAPSPANGGSSDDPTLPMPPGYRPSKASSVRSTSLGDREFIIAQGKLIDAVLETAVNTDQPGMLRALVSDDIYGDSGQTVLLPRGSRLIGQYDSGVVRGQSRVFVIWQRVIRPDGIDVALDSNGTDALGQAGISGKVNNHFFTMFGAATLLSIIGASASTVGVSPGDNNNSIATYRSSVSQGFNDAAGTVLGTFVRIKPTITVRQGASIKVFVARDLYFDSAAIASQHVQVIP